MSKKKKISEKEKRIQARKKAKEKRIQEGLKSGDLEAYRDRDRNLKYRKTIQALAKKHDPSPWRETKEGKPRRESYDMYLHRSEDPTKKYWRLLGEDDDATRALWDAKKKDSERYDDYNQYSLWGPHPKSKLAWNKKRKKMRNKAIPTKYDEE